MDIHLVHGALLGGITWDPFIRGLVIVVAAIIVLPGSVYLVLATDVGGRVGLLLAAAGLSGLLSILAILWLVLSSTAAIGRAPSWKAQQIVTGDYASQVTVNGVSDFPAGDPGTIGRTEASLATQPWYWPFQGCNKTGWQKVNPAKVADPESAADAALAPPTTSTKPTPPQLKSPFSLTSDYTYIGEFTKGADASCLFAVSRHKVYPPFRSAHYDILMVQPVVPVPASVVPPPKPTPDTSKPITYVILRRDLGSVRQPQFAVCISMGLIFLIICNALHRRDKEIQAQRAAERDTVVGAGPGGGAPPRETVGASR